MSKTITRINFDGQKESYSLTDTSKRCQLCKRVADVEVTTELPEDGEFKYLSRKYLCLYHSGYTIDDFYKPFI